ncbi:MAG: hypothetical protein JSV86_18025 [Gemmatimonadota bacterium]|nr:MAG: hypothetical protein JSV86_18025 [Gemmatimonadota bacterium]
MSPLWLKRTKDGLKERRSGTDRRAGKDRRKGHRRDGAGRRGTSELYQSDLDRHLWSWAIPAAAKKRRKAKAKRERHRRIAGVVASAAGALSAAGVSYFLYRRLRENQLPEDPETAEADLDEADFEEDR